MTASSDRATPWQARSTLTAHNASQARIEFPRHRAFSAWRARRLAAAKSELGILDADLLSPAVAIELCDGCSLRCWFCALAPQPLRAVLDHATERDLFRAIVQGCLAVIGAEIAPITLLYHGTEPHDNPHYLDYLRDFEALTGSKVFTSTAVVEDAHWVAGLLRFYGDEAASNLRFNLLSTKSLCWLQRNFPPRALAGVELAIRIEGTGFAFASSGRLLKQSQGGRDLRDLGPDDDPRAASVAQSSIACLNGVKINPPRREIQLIAPCHACRRWPLGYRVFDQAHFHDARDFSAVLTQLLARATSPAPPPEHPLRFRDDLRYRATAGGFDLISPRQIHHFSGAGPAARIGALVADGNRSARDVQRVLIRDQGLNPLMAAALIQGLFDDGFIDERVQPTDIPERPFRPRPATNPSPHVASEL
ncbi:hypothetical protein [Thiorhodovibrio frisius]|uniref:hypothetical protein n=1 Tax=Thiorhodovibrio frisius TaxID=631362 RepID=UPI000255E0D4|nr:hypothetical protein [Thiorhodovibrio frisius]